MATHLSEQSTAAEARAGNTLSRPSAGFALTMVALLSVAAALLPAAVAPSEFASGYWLAVPVIIAASRFGVMGAVIASLIDAVLAGPVIAEIPGLHHTSVSIWLQQLVFLLIVSVVVAGLVRRMQAADARALELVEAQRSAALVAANERIELTEQLQRRVSQDALTGLANREAFGAVLRRRLTKGERLGVLFLDLDDFKAVNDTLGHSIGDELIINVARRLASASRGLDVVARFGGDEFAVLLHEVTPTEAIRAAQRLLSQLAAPFALAGRTLIIRASCGLAYSTGTPPEGVETRATDLLRQADLAMYASKAEHSHGVTAYQQSMQTEMIDRLAMETDLRQAIAGDDLFLSYQPILDLRTGRTTSLEALMRWSHREKGFIPPAKFIPVAEQTGMIVPLTLWALREACSQLRRFDERPDTRGLTMSVNVSGRMVAELGMASAIARELNRDGIAPERLVLEITESLLMEDQSSAVRALCHLRALGCRLSVDDFGTGYSSLSRLNTLPIDQVKIDRSFVEQIDVSDTGRTIVTASVAMAHGLGLPVVAEGIETEQQLKTLRAIGCDEGQGYLFSRPDSAERVAALISSRAQSDGNADVPRQAALQQVIGT
ncbi:MAG: putative bifunctional diguanylate cyclase/phosphodiesterase [Mycobacteriales bacterium]